MDLLVEGELKRALEASGCPLCRVGEEAVRRYLRFVLHESVNDPATRSRLAAAWGFCRRHAWHFLRLEWMTMRDGLGTANITEALVSSLEEILDGYLATPSAGSRGKRARAKVEELVRALTATGECPACGIQEQHEPYALTVLLKVLDDADWGRRFALSHGFCLFHLRRALTAQEAPERVRRIIEDHRRRLHGLKANLEEYIRKHDYRYSHEPAGQERDAFVWATTAVAGSWFDLPGRPGAPGRGTGR